MMLSMLIITSQPPCNGYKEAILSFYKHASAFIIFPEQLCTASSGGHRPLVSAILNAYNFALEVNKSKLKFTHKVFHTAKRFSW